MAKIGFDEKFHPYGPPLEVKEACDEERPWGLICEIENEKALGLYLKLGFKKDGIVDLYGHDYYHMRYVK